MSGSNRSENNFSSAATEFFSKRSAHANLNIFMKSKKITNVRGSLCVPYEIQFTLGEFRWGFVREKRATFHTAVNRVASTGKTLIRLDRSNTDSDLGVQNTNTDYENA